jgi:hypothetical protein
MIAGACGNQKCFTKILFTFCSPNSPLPVLWTVMRTNPTLQGRLIFMNKINCTYHLFNITIINIAIQVLSTIVASRLESSVLSNNDGMNVPAKPVSTGRYYT